MASLASVQVRSTTVYGLLGSGGRVNGGHQTFYHTEFIVQHFGDRGEAVGRAGSVRNDSLSFVGVVVYTHYEHRGVVLRRSRHHDAFRTGFDVGFGLLFGQEQTGRLYYVFGADFVPFQVCGVFLSSYADRLTVDNQIAVFNFDGTLELAVHRVVTQHVSHVFYANQVVDADNFNIVLGHSGTEHQTADAAETVDTDFNL